MLLDIVLQHVTVKLDELLSLTFSFFFYLSLSLSPQITINHEAGGLLICLLKSCLNALSFCLEASPPPATATLASSLSGSYSSPALKLIEEILQYLTKLINYAPGECVACLRQLLKYLFAQNYASDVQRQPNGFHATFVRPYFAARRSDNMANGHGNGSTAAAAAAAGSTLLPTAAMNPAITTQTAAAKTTTTVQQLISTYPAALGALFVQGMKAQSTPPAGDCVRLIKLFEPLVIYCLTVSCNC